MSIRHGSLPIISVLCIALAAHGAPPDYGGEIVTVKSRDIEISYSVHQAAKSWPPVARVGQIEKVLPWLPIRAVAKAR